MDDLRLAKSYGWVVVAERHKVKTLRARAAARRLLARKDGRIKDLERQFESKQQDYLDLVKLASDQEWRAIRAEEQLAAAISRAEQAEEGARLALSSKDSSEAAIAHMGAELRLLAEGWRLLQELTEFETPFEALHQDVLDDVVQDRCRLVGGYVPEGTAKQAAALLNAAGELAGCVLAPLRPPEPRYRCCAAGCPGYPWKASERPHPCSSPEPAGDKDEEPEPSERKRQVDLWEAIHDYVRACGGSPENPRYPAAAAAVTRVEAVAFGAEPAVTEPRPLQVGEADMRRAQRAAYAALNDPRVTRVEHIQKAAEDALKPAVTEPRPLQVGDRVRYVGPAPSMRGEEGDYLGSPEKCIFSEGYDYAVDFDDSDIGHQHVKLSSLQRIDAPPSEGESDAG